MSIEHWQDTDLLSRESTIGSSLNLLATTVVSDGDAASANDGGALLMSQARARNLEKMQAQAIADLGLDRLITAAAERLERRVSTLIAATVAPDNRDGAISIARDAIIEMQREVIGDA